jgi:hypothetical protein
VIRKGKHISREDATDVRAGWADRDCVRPAGMARPVGWLGQRPNGLQGWPGRKQGKMISELKIGFFFEFTKALEICRRFRRNFDMRIFPKFF